MENKHSTYFLRFSYMNIIDKLYDETEVAVRDFNEKVILKNFSKSLFN